MVNCTRYSAYGWLEGWQCKKATRNCLLHCSKKITIFEQMHAVKYSGPYKNNKACKSFIFGISEYFFEENIKSKLASVNFWAVLCDGSTDKSITE